MPVDFNFLVGGEAGQGIQTVGFILAKAMMRGGYAVYSDQDYESRIRGGHSFSRIRVADRDVRALVERVNVLVAFNQETVDRHRSELLPDGEGVVILDPDKVKGEGGDGVLPVPLDGLAEQAGGNKLMANTVALGAALGLVAYDFDKLAAVLREQFAAQADVAEGNVKAARAGYDFAREHCPAGFTRRLPVIGPSQCILLTGHEAVALGALAAGCNFAAGYPMTPTTPILEYLASKGKDYGVKMIQAEDEISAMNMVVGAAYAGARAMTATSGGGFCLMVEALSLAGMTETPVVVVLGQRPGPAIGLPTRSEQGELLFALHAGHGEFPRAILAPATVEDGFWLTVKAFNLAEKYQSPVLILTDHDCADSYVTVTPFDLSEVHIDRGDIVAFEDEAAAREYRRHAITPSGVSPRAFPLHGKQLVVTDSDEHDEAGHITEDAGVRRQMVSKRMRKLDGLRGEIGRPRSHESPGAAATLVGWGGTYGPIMEARGILAAEGIPVNALHLSELWPFPAQDVAAALGGGRRSVVIESNATGQLAALIRQETGIKADAAILKFDGRPFSASYIVNELK